jgi:hypothetical protein
MHDWQRRELAERIATGAAIYSLLRQGYLIADVVDALDLADCREAQRLVALFLLHGNPKAAK